MGDQFKDFTFGSDDLDNEEEFLQSQEAFQIRTFPKVEYGDVKLATNSGNGGAALGKMVEDDPKLRELEMKLYNYENLNEQQRSVFDYVKDHPRDIVLLQAGPGCGKSFLLKTIAYSKSNTVAVVYKHDLVDTFSQCSALYTVAKFIMEILNIQYMTYIAFDMQLSSNIGSFEYLSTMAACIKRANMGQFRSKFILLDEYTVLNKSILVMLLILFEYFGIGAIICGDKDQLQNIHNSTHTKMSSFSLAKMFAKKTFNLDVNVRCSDSNYNEIIKYMSKFSSSAKLDAFAFAMIAAIFPKQLSAPNKFEYVHLAATHQELTNTIHQMVCSENIPAEFYVIDYTNTRSKGMCDPKYPERVIEYVNTESKSTNPQVGKFLPYLPIQIGSRYYVLKHREAYQGILIDFDMEMGICTIQDLFGNVHHYSKSGQDEVLFEEHRNWLKDGDVGRLFNYPIYPANIMSIHKCQGCTISENIDVNFAKSNYQGMYVAMSRVKSPNQIARVTIPFQIQNLISVIINIPEMLNPDYVATKEIIETRFRNFIYYEVEDLITFGNLALSFLLAETVKERKKIRESIISKVSKCRTRKLQSPLETKTEDVCESIMILKIINYRDVLLALSAFDTVDRFVWLHEFCKLNLEFLSSLQLNGNIDSKEMSEGVLEMELLASSKSSLNSIVEFEKGFGMTVSSRSFIKYYSQIVAFDGEGVIEKTPNGFYRKTSVFSAKVYKKYENNEPIDFEWLYSELLLANKQETDVVPVKSCKRISLAEAFSKMKRSRK